MAGEIVRSSQPWPAYVAAARRLAELRAGHQAQQAGHGQARAQAVELINTLAAQYGRLTELARRLRMSPPGAPGTATDPAPVDVRLARAQTLMRQAEAAAAQAQAGGVPARLLPDVTPRTRNAVVYGAFALVALAAQLVTIALYDQRVVADQFGTYAWSCCGFPAFAFIAGYLAVGFVGPPRVDDEKVDRTPKMGALICAASLPIYLLVVIALGRLF